ncbi:MAG: alanine racemase [Lachnospiraceae bacterium]|nr:alanine racemase [Lachnospiraceae bacterium]
MKEGLNGSAYVEINNTIIEQNARIMCRAFPHEYNIAVVKGNAYGHGYGVIPAMVKGGINAFAVARLSEALQVRDYDKLHPVIMLEPVMPELLKTCADNNVSICVCDRETLEEAVNSGLKLKIQLKIDCGMNRLGFKDATEITEVVKRIDESGLLFLEGVFSHFHTSGSVDPEYAGDLKRFEELTSGIDLSKVHMVHLDKTQTLILHDTPEYANGARIGIALYGFTTVHDLPTTIKGRIRRAQRDFMRKRYHVPDCKPIVEYDVKKAFTLYTRVLQVKEAKPGEYVGYGLLHHVLAPETVATIDIGYSDGIDRRRFGSFVSIGGKKCPIIGEVGMNMCQVLADPTVKRGDLVTVLGGAVPIVSVTGHVGTTMYELMTDIDSSIPRVYVD